jgi:RNA polymerase sigma factor (sigma-70 family)
VACVARHPSNLVTAPRKKRFKRTQFLDLDKYIFAAKSNDQKAFNYILNICWNEVYGFILKRTQNENDAEDITIQTFARAFDKIDSFNAEFQFKTWLITIAKNIHIDTLRRSKSHLMEESEQSHQSVMATLADINPTPEDALITAQKLSELRDNIKKLKPHYQEVIQLFYFQELSYAEMAEKLQEPLSRIKVKLLRARQLLASIISASGQ